MSRKPKGYWNERTILAEVKQIMETHGYEELPSRKELKNLGHGGLIPAVFRFYPDSFRGLRRDLGEVNSRKPAGYWQNKDNILVEAQLAMDAHGRKQFFSAAELAKLGYSGLAHAVYKYYPDSFRGLRRDLGGTNSSKPNGYWNEHTIFEEAKRIKEELGYDRLPTQKGLYDLGFSGFSTAISQYYTGGFRGLRRDLGEVSSRKPDGYWDNQNNIFAEAQIMMDECGLDQLPSASKLKHSGYSSLCSAISKSYSGGLHALRRDLQEQSTPGLSHVRELTQQSPELAQLVNELYPATKTSIPSVGDAITPIDLPAVGSWYEAVVGKKDVDEDTLVRIDEVLYGLLQTEYQIKYNENPAQTLEELTQLQHEQPALTTITTKLVNYFTSVDEFDIPGF